MADEPTAIRHPRIPVWHRHRHRTDFTTACGLGLLDTAAMTQARPLSRTLPEERCRTCWKDTP